MAESQHDDLADALARMAAGDVAPSEHEPEPPAVPSPPHARAVRPVTGRPATGKPGPAQSAKPAAASPSTPTPAPARPVAPVRARPAAPTLSSTTPPVPDVPSPPMVVPPGARRVRPAAPTVRSVVVSNEQNQPEIDGGQSTGLSAEAGTTEVIDDDEDRMVLPYVASPDTNSAAQARAKAARRKNLEFRRTLIPILLTSGVLMLAFASLKFVTGSDSTLSDLPIWIPAVLVMMALILLSLAAMNMLSVKKQLEQK